MKRNSIMILFLLFLTACSTEDITSETAQRQSIPVETFTIKEVDLQRTMEITGQTVPNTIIPLFSPTPLEVLEVNKKVGESVKKGEQIIKLEDSAAKAQVNQANQAVSELSNALNKAKELEQSTQQNLVALKQLEKELSESLNKSRQLIERLEDEETEVTMLAVIQNTLEVALKQAELTQSATKISSLPQLNTRELEMQLDLAKENVNKAQQLVDATTITSPINGTIAEINVSKSQTALPNTMLATVVNITPMIATFPTNSYQVVQLSTGMNATVSIDGIDERFDSQITTVSPTVQPQTNLFEVKIPVPNDDQRVKGGMRVTAYIDLGGVERAIVTPVTSILYDENSPYVYVVNENSVKRTEVVLGIRNNDLIQVHEGLNIDDIVITRGKERLTDGAKITVRNEENNENS